MCWCTRTQPHRAELGVGLGHRGGAKPIVELLLLPEELTPKLPNTLVKLFRCEADFCQSSPPLSLFTLSLLLRGLWRLLSSPNALYFSPADLFRSHLGILPSLQEPTAEILPSRHLYLPVVACTTNRWGEDRCVLGCGEYRDSVEVFELPG